MARTILVIDDSPTEASIVKNILEKAGYEVLWADNAASGIAMAEEKQPDLILMDVVMPGMNGFQATRKLSKTEKTAKIPIIMLTTKDQRSDQVWGLKMGAKKYMVKPPQESELLAEVRALIG